MSGVFGRSSEDAERSLVHAAVYRALRAGDVQEPYSEKTLHTVLKGILDSEKVKSDDGSLKKLVKQLEGTGVLYRHEISGVGSYYFLNVNYSPPSAEEPAYSQWRSEVPQPRRSLFSDIYGSSEQAKAFEAEKEGLEEAISTMHSFVSQLEGSANIVDIHERPERWKQAFSDARSELNMYEDIVSYFNDVKDRADWTFIRGNDLLQRLDAESAYKSIIDNAKGLRELIFGVWSENMASSIKTLRENSRYLIGVQMRLESVQEEIKEHTAVLNLQRDRQLRDLFIDNLQSKEESVLQKFREIEDIVPGNLEPGEGEAFRTAVLEFKERLDAVMKKAG